MKKFYAFAVAALMSASMFAVAPTAADLAKEYDLTSNVVLCINPIEDAQVCNDIRFVGTPNNWGKGDVEGATEAFDNCEKFMPVKGFDGWYAAELPYSAGFEGKPVQEPADRAWSWDYQCGDVDAWVFVDGKTMNIAAGFADECNISMPEAGAYIYQLKYWKKHKNPCKPVVKHNYTIKLYSPTICGDFKPAVAGDDMGWGINAMNEGLDDDFNTVYTYTFEGQEGHTFKFRPTDDDDQWTKQMQFNDKGEDKWVNGDNIELPVATKDTTLVFDYSDDTKYRWAACDSEAASQVYVTLKAPAGAPAYVEVIGTFDGWTGTAMNYKDGKWEALIAAKSSDAFKFRSGIGETSDDKWANQIQEFVNEDWANMENMEFGEKWIEGEDYNTVNCDFSDPAMYKWTIENQQGIENVVLTEKAQKVVVDGVIYIIRNNKMFNLQGAQVR